MTTTIENNSSHAIEKSTHVLKANADKIIRRNTLFAAGAGLIPIPFLDTGVVLGVQLNMIRKIANQYDVEFKDHIVKSLIASLVGSLTTIGAIKLIPGVGTLIGGATYAATSAAVTYALGQVFTHHFDQGGTLLNFDPVKSREFFKQEYEAGRMFVSEISETEEEVEKTKKSTWKKYIPTIGKSKAKTADEAVVNEELVELQKTNQELKAMLEELKSSVEELKGNA